MLNHPHPLAQTPGYFHRLFHFSYSGPGHQNCPQAKGVGRFYILFGGVPAYWELLDSELSISQNIRLQWLTSTHLIWAEPRLLQDFIAEQHNYRTVLTAIADGAHTPKEIANGSGIPKIQVPKYLSVSNEAGFVERRIPGTQRGTTPSRQHHITYPFLCFYLCFLVSRLDQFVLGVQDRALAEINRHLIDFMDAHA